MSIVVKNPATGEMLSPDYYWGESLCFYFRKPFGAAAALAAEAKAGIDDDPDLREGYRHKLPFYAEYPLDQHTIRNNLQSPVIYWEIFHHYVHSATGSCDGFMDIGSPPWEDKRIKKLSQQTNELRSDSFDLMKRSIIDQREEGAKILIGPPWASTTLDFIADLDQFAQQTIRILKDENTPPEVAKRIKADIQHWLDKSVTESAQKNRYGTSPEAITSLIDAIKEMEPYFFRELPGGFATFASQSMHPVGGEALFVLNHEKTPAILFDRLQFPFDFISPDGTIHRFVPGSNNFGNPDLRGNIVVEAQTFTSTPASLDELAELVECNDIAKSCLHNLSDTTSILNGSIKSAILEVQTQTLIDQSRQASAALITGIQKIKEAHFASIFEKMLEEMECPLIVDFTPPPKDEIVPHEISARVFQALRNSSAISMVTLNTSESVHILERLGQACLVDEGLRNAVNAGDLGELYSLAPPIGEVIQEGENPKYIKKLSEFLARILECPVRVRGRSADCVSYPGVLEEEEKKFLIHMITGTRQFGSLKANAPEGFPVTEEEMQYFGTELHPRNFAGACVAIEEDGKLAIGENYTETFSTVNYSDEKDPVTTIVGIAEEFPAHAPSKISVGDYIAILMARLYGRKRSQGLVLEDLSEVVARHGYKKAA